MGNTRDLRQAAAQLSGKGVMSTAMIMTVLFRGSMKAPSEIKEQDRVISLGARLDDQLTHLLNDVKRDNFKQLENFRDEAQTYLDGLGSSRTTSAFQQQYLPELSLLNKDLTQIGTNRDSLLKEKIGTLIEEQQKRIPELLSQYAQGKVSSDEVLRDLKNYQSKQDSLTSECKAIKTNLDALAPKLANLVRKTKEVYYNTQDITAQQNPRPER